MLVVRHPGSYAAERRYVMDVVLGEFLGLQYATELHHGEHVSIEASGEPGRRRLHLADVLFSTPSERWLTTGALPVEPLERWRVPEELSAPIGTLPVLFARTERGRPLYEETPEGSTWRIDLFGTAFFLLTRYEEAVRGERDQHGRFPADASIASRNRFLDYPVVDAYVEVLSSIMTRLWPGLVRRRHEYRVRLSHDVDRPYCVKGRTVGALVRSLAGDVARRRDANLALRRLKAYVAAAQGAVRDDPCDTFDFLMSQSERKGWRSAFYFMAGCGAPGIDGDYDLDSPGIRGLIRQVSERGHEVGLHPSYLTCLDGGRLALEFERLRAIATEEGVRQSAWGGRQHYLRWQNPETWQGWEDAGLAYDSTLGYPERPGFRCGVGREFPVFNLRTRTPLRLRERPLVLMDTALFRHAAPGGRKMLDAALALCDTCRRFRADLTILWHNSNLLSRRQKAEYLALCEAL